MRKPARVPWTALVVAAAAVLFFARMRARADPDLFFHLKEGSRVVLEGRLPLVEDYSFTRAGKEMVAVEWLSGAAYYAAFRLGGPAGTAGLGALLLAGTLALAALALGDEVPEPLRALLIALAAFGLLNFALAKVQGFTFLLFAAHLHWIRLWERGRRWVPWAMAASLALWVNLHGGFMLGWVLLGGVCTLDFRREGRLAALAPWAAGTFACFLHPNGATAFVYPLWFMLAPPAGRALVVEWRPLAVETSALPYALILAAALAARPWRRSGPFPWAALAAVFLVMTLRARKMAPFFALTAVVAAGLAAKGPRSSRARSALALAGALAALAAIGAVEAREARALAPLGPASDFEREYPRAAADFVAARLPGRRLFHPYEWGGYLLWRLSPAARVFIDGRLDPYWTLLGDYATLAGARPGWEDLLSAYGIEAALLRPGSPLAARLARDPGWSLAYADGRALVFARRLPEGR